MSARYIIIGAGEAGIAAAAALREGDPVATITVIGDESILPYERPPLSKEVLLGEQGDPKLIRPETWYAENAVTLRLGERVDHINAPNRQVVLRDGGSERRLDYDALLIATGARVRRLPDSSDRIRYLRSFDDATALRDAVAGARSVGVIGGGVIGLEVAASAAKAGKRVTIFEPAGRLMSRALTEDVSDYLADLHRAAGTTVLTGIGALRVSERGGGVEIATGDATHAVDVCVAGIGVMPNSELAEAAGCEVDNGILVDSCGRTSVAGIHAAGDVAAFHDVALGRPLRLEAWQHADRHGAHVARAMLGQSDDYVEVPWFWTDQLGVNVQVAGLATGSDHSVWRGDGGQRTGFHFIDDRLVAATTINNGRDMRPSIKLLASRWRGDPATLADMSRPLGKFVTDLLRQDG